MVAVSDLAVNSVQAILLFIFVQVPKL